MLIKILPREHQCVVCGASFQSINQYYSPAHLSFLSLSLSHPIHPLSVFIYVYLSLCIYLPSSLFLISLSLSLSLISLSFMHSCCLHICRFLHGRSARPEMRARFCARPCRAQYHPYIIDRVIQIY